MLERLLLITEAYFSAFKIHIQQKYIFFYVIQKP